MRTILGVAALMVNFIGYIPYLRDIFRKNVKPHPITWGVWTILTTIAAVNQIKNGGGWSSLFFVSTTFLVCLVFLLSLRYGFKGTTRLDIMCLALAVVLLAYWLSVQETRVSTLIAVIIDGIGAVPTVLKTYRHPATETYPQWVLAGVAGLLTMLSVPRLDWALIIYPAYVLVMNGVIVATKFAREHS